MRTLPTDTMLATAMTIWKSKISRHYRDRGYQLFRGVFPRQEVETIAQAARLVSHFEDRLRRQNGQFEVNEFFPNTRLVRNTLLHPHLGLPEPLTPLSSALRSLVTSDALGQRLRGLDGERHYIIHQVLLFFTTQSTDVHLDSWSVDTAPLGRTHTVWVPLQDMTHRSGVPCVIPWPRDKVVTEQALGLTPHQDDPRDARYGAYHKALRAKLMEGSPETATSLMRMGDFMVWSSLTPHLTLPPQHLPAERLSLQILIRPERLNWGDFMHQPFDRNHLRLQKVSDYFSIRVMDEQR